MNFFAQQERSRSHTRRMLILFALAVLSIVAAVDIVVMIAFGAFGDKQHALASARHVPPQALFLSTLAVLGIVAAATAYKISTLRSGGGAVARQFGATEVAADTTNFAYRRLRNVVEEIAIASGVPVPEIYVLEDEPAINAFAAGYTTADAAVTVTRGCLDKLTRDELQGVIAHEFSHVLNGDMRLNIRLMGVLFGILVIGIAGRKLIENTGPQPRFRRHRGVRHRGAGDRLPRRILRPPDQGRHLAPARVSGRRVGRAVHAADARHRRRAEEDRRPRRRIEARQRRDRGSRAHAVRRRRRLFSAVCDASAFAQAHQAARSAVQPEGIRGHRPRLVAAGAVR